MKVKKTRYLIPLLILTIIIAFCSFSCSTPGPSNQIIEELAQETAEEITVEESEEEVKEEVAAEEPVEEPVEAAKLEKIDSLLASEAIRWNLSVNGEVKEISISGRNLTIAGFTETGEETSPLIVPISQEAKIISDYILPAEAAKEEITGTISTSAGKEYNLGEKEIIIEDIKVGDSVFIRLNLKPDYTIEGIEVRVFPVDLIPLE